MNASIRTRGRGTLLVEAQRSRTPGLIIHRALSPLEGVRWWSVTHEDSGLSLTDFAKLSSARRFALELGPLADWTRPEAELTRKGAVDVKRLRQIRDAIRVEEES